MPGFPPKTSRGGANKSNNIGSPIAIKSFSSNTTSEKHSSIDKFINSASAEEQLGILKSIIEEQKDSIDERVVQFLAIVFYEAPAKHPLKCFLSRHVTKCTAIQKTFTNLLTAHILSEIKGDVNCHKYDYYAERVPKVMQCIENFPCGAVSVEGVGVDLLTEYLFFNYFFTCRKELRNSTLSPTKKNEIFNLEHVMLRLIIHIIQKLDIHGSEHKSNWAASFQSGGFNNIMSCVHALISDEEVPMDTKSLSGILILSADNLRTSSDDAWKLLLPTCIDYSKLTDASETNYYHRVLRHKLGRLAVYSAIASTVSMDLLQDAVLMLTEQLLSYADGSASEPAETVVVTRALVQLSRSLGGAGGRVVAALLPFVWAHLEFHLDSVRHLTNQILAACLDYCADLERRDESAPLESVLRSVRALGEARSFYWAVSRAVPALGASRVLRDLCDASALLRAAATPDLQAAASTAISALLAGGACAGLETNEVFDRWVRPALSSPAALQAVLPSAVAAHPALVDYIGSNVHGLAALACARAAPACRACLTQRALRAAAIHKDDESRILALSLVAESARSTAGVPRAELRAVLWLLRYNLAAPRAGFRAALLANLNKVLKRLEDSHRPMTRRGEDTEHYGEFIEQVRALCFAAALPGASPGRRSAALQLLAGTHAVLPAVTRVWTAEHVETLLQHLDDSYDSNKATALQVLQHCPLQLLEECTRELSLEAVLRGAVSPRAAGGAGAAARLELLLSRLPHRVPLPPDALLVREEALRPHYAVLRALLRQLRAVAAGAAGDAAREARRGGAPGTLRCAAAVLRRRDLAAAEWRREPWSLLAADLEAECLRACARAEPVVAHPAPEGHLPAPAASGPEAGEGEAGPVTAQMVLACAWRTVKEAAALAALLAPRTGAPRAGERLVALLTRALHRGAVDQAAAGLAAAAHGWWSDERCAHWPRQWARELVALAERGAAHATRRGAGLPAAIQALLSSEVSATGRAECFHECMAELLRLASNDAPTDAPTDAHAPADAGPRRTLAANILRALFRHAALEKESQKHVGAGLRLALQGFEAASWPERTAMSLLYCAVSVRVFGVTRARGAELHARNTLPAALFFQRYPGIYDLMLSKLQEFEPGSAAGPGVLPVLLLLARLYPSAVEGAASSLKVSAFVGLVQRCACASELRVRRLAARALPTLLPPTERFPYIERLLAATCRPDLLHNHWHGALLTLTSLLERAPPAPPAPPGGARAPAGAPALAQAAGPRPCYVVAREYVNVLNLLIWKFPEMLPGEVLASVLEYLEVIIFSGAPAGPDRELCLADCSLLYFIVLHKEKRVERILPLINRTLGHASYEVVLAALDYLLIQRDALLTTDTELCNFRRHLLAIRDVTTLQNIKETSDYKTMITKLSDCLHDAKKYPECRVKSLKLLSLEDNTQMLIVNEVFPSHLSDRTERLARRLIHRIEENHDNVKHMFLESLLKLIKESRGELHRDAILDVYRVMYECSSAHNSVDTRMAVVGYFESYFDWEMAASGNFNPEQLFLFNALVLSTLVTLLEDDDDVVRERAADVIARVSSPCTLPDDEEAPGEVSVCVEDAASLGRLTRAARDAAGGVVASAAGELARARAARLGAPALLLLALLDFRADLGLADRLADECRVFEQSERHNICLEESVWTAACADLLVRAAPHHPAGLLERALAITRDRRYSSAFQALCKDNVKLFQNMATGDFVPDETVNPKIGILVRKLRG